MRTILADWREPGADTDRPAAIRSSYRSMAIATGTAFVFSSLYYAMLASTWRAVDPASLAGTPASPLRIGAEIVRTFAIVCVLARLLRMLGSRGWVSVLSLASLLWFGFSFVMWTGAIMWEGTPWAVAAIHSGDWLIKSLLISSLLYVLRTRAPRAPKGP